MMNAWKLLKGGFDRWEASTAEYLDEALQNPNVLGPSATVMHMVMKAKSSTSGWLSRRVHSLGLTTRGDQEVTLHRINQLESRILDLQEEIVNLRDAR